MWDGDTSFLTHGRWRLSLWVTFNRVLPPKNPLELVESVR